MPGVTTTGSTTIAVLNSRIIADLCLGKICVDVTPSIYIGSGKDLVLGANVQITNPFGVIVKPYGANYEIAPGLSGGMDAAICFNIPTQAGNYQYGQYTIDVTLYDDAGTPFTVTKTIKICEPDANNKTRSYGSLSATVRGVCKDGKVYIIVDGVPNYNGKQVESQVNSFTIEYPSGSGLANLVTTLGYLSLQLYEGVYKVTGEICATYNFGDSLYVKVKYKVKKEKNIKCVIDECCVMQMLAELHQKLKTDCTQAEKDNTASVIVDALRLLKTAQLAAECGEDPTTYIDDLEALLGCKCTCNCNEGTPIIPVATSKDFVIEGCNVSKQTVGLVDTYTIENYAYTVAVTPNGGVLVISDPVLSDCTKTQTLTFDISVAYSQIKTLANQNNTEGDFWASVINKSLRDVDPDCLGITVPAWQALSYPAKWAAVINKLCLCCGTCGAEVVVGNITCTGANVLLEYTCNPSTDIIDFYLDGIFVGSQICGSADGFTFMGAADGEEHTYRIIPRCSDGSRGTVIDGTFFFLGCAEIAMPSVTSEIVTDAVCPYDLTSLESAPPLGISYEWHNSNSTDPDTLVSDPTKAVSGVFYLFAKDAIGCFSSGQKVTLICNTAESCSAPQNLKANYVSGNHVVSFQSAAFPPPGNSYTVKRKLASDPDVDGAYTTIGTPIWNATDSKWQIIDGTASNNILYTYKAQSNCGGSPATTPYTTSNYVNITCPSVTLTPGNTDIDYSFAPLGGDIDKYKVNIYDNTGLVLIETDTHLPAFSNPTIGTFEYLTQGTDYKVAVTVYVGAYSRTCAAETVTTLVP